AAPPLSSSAARTRRDAVAERLEQPKRIDSAAGAVSGAATDRGEARTRGAFGQAARAKACETAGARGWRGRRREIAATVLGQPLHAGRVRRALAVVRGPRLELREAALRRLVATGILRHRLVDAALRVRVRRLPGRLGPLETLEQRCQILRRALLLARGALRLVAPPRVDGRD